MKTQMIQTTRRDLFWPLIVALAFSGLALPRLQAQSGTKSYDQLKRAWGSTVRSFGGPKKTVRKTTRGIQVVEVEVETETSVSFDNVLFKLDSTELANQSSKDQLEIIAKVMKDLPNYQFLIEGHTCDLGPTSHNKTLSENRADAIRTFLVRQGVNGSRLETLGFGESDPTVANSSESNRQKNRRVVVYRKSS